ncbi:IclR family transcriptional regulator [Halobacteriales archaeon Cl-PHB]
MATQVPIQSARRAFEVLEALESKGPATLSEVQAEFDMAQSTAHDYLQTLHDMEYVVKERGRYRPSTRCLSLGVSVREGMQLYRLAKHEVDDLAARTDDHVSIMIEEHGLGTLLYIERGEKAFDLGVTEGWRMELPTNAPGKAILAHLPADRIEAILDEHGMPKITEATITDREVLLDRLSTIRDRGYAVDLGERVEGVRAVSAPIVTNGQVHGALTITGSTKRLSGDRFTERLPRLLQEAANVVEVQYTLDRNRD